MHVQRRKSKCTTPRNHQISFIVEGFGDMKVGTSCGGGVSAHSSHIGFWGPGFVNHIIFMSKL